MLIEIYQVRDDLDRKHQPMIRNKNYDYISQYITDFYSELPNWYQKVYEYDLDINNIDESFINGDELTNYEILDYIFYTFTTDNCPNDYNGREMSLSDIVIINNIIYFCDNRIWRKII